MITGLIIILPLYTITFVIAEILYRKGYAVKTTRKIVHIGAGAVSFFLPLLVNLQIAVTIGVLFVCLLYWTEKRRLLESVHKIGNKNFGAILFPIGLIVCALIFWNINPLIFQSSALIVGLSDGLAGVFGQKFGKREYNFTGRKTLEGSFLFFIITCGILLLTVLFYKDTIGLPKIFLIALGSLGLTIVEGLFGKGWDNLFIPIFAGLTIYLIL